MKKLYVVGLFIAMILFSRVEAYGSCSSYGLFAVETYDGMCKCMSGYGRSTDIFGNQSCKSMTTVCSERLGYNATYSYSEDSCVCRSGYELSLDSKGYSCQSCFSKYGLHSSFSYLSKQCECDSGYTPKDGKCIEKQNNVYALLLELKTDSREAKISFDIDGDSKFDDDFYYVKYSNGCYSSDIKRYLGKLLVVNLGTDFYLDARDKIVLPEEGYGCDVSSRKKVSNEFSIFTCEELFGDHSYEVSEGKCACDEGYEFSNSKCVEKQIDTSYYYPVIIKSNIELETAISRMYVNGLTKFNTVSDFNPDGELTREQASKFYVQFSTNQLGKTFDPSIVAKFDDLSDADPSLQSFISLAYNFGLFKGSNGKFKPFDKLSRAQAIAVAIRSKYGYQNETYSERYSEYYALAKSYGLIDGLDFDYSTLGSTNITRGEVAILLYRLSNLK